MTASQNRGAAKLVIPAVIGDYLSARHRDAPGTGCPTAAMVGVLVQSSINAEMSFACHASLKSRTMLAWRPAGTAPRRQSARWPADPCSRTQ